MNSQINLNQKQINKFLKPGVKFSEEMNGRIQLHQTAHQTFSNVMGITCSLIALSMGIPISPHFPSKSVSLTFTLAASQVTSLCPDILQLS